MASASLKQEAPTGESPQGLDPIKLDAEGDVKMAMDDEGYEDTGDLEIKQPLPQAWLVRLPQMVYDEWNKIGDDEEITLGHLVQYPNADKWYMSLDGKVEQNKKLPKQHKIHMTPDNTPNTFVFSERDLPEYKRKARQDNSHSRGHYHGINRYSRYRKSVPKQTRLEAVIRRELTCDATDSSDFREELRRKLQETDKVSTGFLQGDPNQYMSKYTIGKTQDLQRMMAGPQGGIRKKPLDQRAARIPENELLDLIFKCFRKHRYWPMVALKREINQPQEYLRETLLKVAVFVKSGDYYNTYRLKPEQAQAHGIGLDDGQTLAPLLSKEEEEARRLAKDEDVSSPDAKGSDEDEDDDDK